MKPLLKPTFIKIVLTVLLFILSGWLWRMYIISRISDTFPFGFPLQFYLAWGPCQPNEVCSEFNSLYLFIDLVFWYFVSAFIKTILFFILAPGMVAGLIPLAFFRNGNQINTGIFSYLAFPLWIIGIATLVWCFWDFVQKGKGTPAPNDPPKELVVAGLYKYVRNPMYVGVFLVNAGYFLWFGYWNLLLYLALYFVVVHSFVTLYEEPHLKKTFGVSYEEYLKKTPRWIPRFK